MPDAHDTDTRATLLSAASLDLLGLMWDLRKLAGETFAPLGFTLVQAALFTYITRGVTQPKVLAEFLGIHPAAVSTLLLRFEKLSLIERTALPQDKRYVDVALTSKGAEYANALSSSWQQANSTSLAKLSDDELQQLIQLCRKMYPSNVPEQEA